MIYTTFNNLSLGYNVFCSRCFPVSPKGECASDTGEAEKTTRLFFLVEMHNNPNDRKRNRASLEKNYSYERGDLVLVEDDELKPPDKLNLSQLDGFKPRNLRVEGWDPHESCQERLKAQQLLINIDNTAKRVKKGTGKEKDINFLLREAKQVNLKALEAVRQYSSHELLTNPELQSKRSTFAASCRQYAQQARGVIGYKHFHRRQEALIEKIQTCLESDVRGHIFVMTGKNHLNAENNVIKEDVSTLLSFLEGKQWQMI